MVPNYPHNWKFSTYYFYICKFFPLILILDYKTWKFSTYAEKQFFFSTYSDINLLMKIFDTFIQRNLSDIEYKRLIQLGWVR